MTIFCDIIFESAVSRENKIITRIILLDTIWFRRS